MTEEAKRPKRKKQPERTKDQDRQGLRKKVRMFYDLQRLRMQMGGRVKPKGEGAEVQLHEFDQEILSVRADNLHKAEKLALADIRHHLKATKMWKDVLSDRELYKGLGPTMAAVILSEFDIHREDTPSKMWAFAGLAPVPCRRCRKCQAVVSEIADANWKHPATGTCELKGSKVGALATFASAKAMRPVKGEKLKYNAFLKTKLIGVLGPCLLKANSPWRKFYDDYKHRKASAGWGMSDGHRHNAAIRYMVKMLLLDIWKAWRAMEGLPIRPSYQEQYLGHTHGADMRAAPIT